jgi:RecB family exonuclease
MKRKKAEEGKGREKGSTGHKVITGDFRALEPAFLAEIRRAREADSLRPIVILVTSHILGLHLQRYLPQNGLNHINLRFFTIEGFAEEVAKPELIRLGKSRLPRFAPPEIVRMVTAGLKAKKGAAASPGFYFEAIAERRGFHDAILATIDDLKNARISPDGLRKVLPEYGAPSGAANAKKPTRPRSPARGAAKALNTAKVRDLLKIWEGYEEVLSRQGWLDDNDVLRMAADLIPEDTLLQNSAGVIAYGFYDFNELEKRIIHACFENKETTLFVPYEPTPAFAYAEPTIEWLKSDGFKVRQAEAVLQDDPDSLKAPSRPATLAHLTDLLFLDGAGAGDKAARGPKTPASSRQSRDETLTIISAPGELREVRELTRLIIHDALKHETGFWECGILPRAPETYTSIIRETARGLGLKPYMPGGIPLAAARPGRSLILLLDILRDDYGRRSVMEFATFARLRGHFTRIRGAAYRPAAWDVISMEAGIVGGKKEWAERLSTLLKDVSRQYDESEQGWRRAVPGGPDAVKALIEFMDALIKALAPVASGATWGEKVEAVEAALLCLVEDDESDRDAAQIGEESQSTVAAGGNGRSLTQEVLDAIRSLRELDALIDPGKPETQPSVEEFCDGVRDVLQSTVLALGKFQHNGPAVIPLMRARGIPFKTVVLPGLVEKEFPPLVRQDAILLDHEREVLNRALTSDGGRQPGMPGAAADGEGPIPLKARRRLDEERLLFRLAVGAATERLILTFPRLEMVTARERLPSSFLLAVVEAMTGERSDFGALEKFHALVRIPLSRIASEDPADALDAVEFDLSRALGDIRTGRTASIMHMREASPTLARALRLEAERWGRPVFTCYDGFLCHAAARRMLKECYTIINKEVSPTRLETFATCPYQYLLGSIMGLRDLVEPELAHKLSPLDRGAIVHDILFRFLTELGNEASPGNADPDKIRTGAVGIQVKEKHRAMLHRVAGREFREFEKKGITGFPALWTFEKERMMEWLDTVFDELVEEDEYLPAYFEVRYGMKSRSPYESEISTDDPVPLAFKRRQVLLRGKIDRIDITPDGRRARIIDYKTGKGRSKANDLEGGTSLQLPLYLTAAAHILAKRHPGIRAEYAEYYHLPEKASKRHIRFDSEALEETRPELEAILDTIAGSIESGHFFAVPGDQCEYCDFLTICGATRHAIFDMKSGDPNIRKYLEMTGEAESEGEDEDEGGGD